MASVNLGSHYEIKLLKPQQRKNVPNRKKQVGTFVLFHSCLFWQRKCELPTQFLPSFALREAHIFKTWQFFFFFFMSIRIRYIRYSNFTLAALISPHFNEQNKPCFPFFFPLSFAIYQLNAKLSDRKKSLTKIKTEEKSIRSLGAAF